MLVIARDKLKNWQSQKLSLIFNRPKIEIIEKRIKGVDILSGDGVGSVKVADTSCRTGRQSPYRCGSSISPNTGPKAIKSRSNGVIERN